MSISSKAVNYKKLFENALDYIKDFDEDHANLLHSVLEQIVKNLAKEPVNNFEVPSKALQGLLQKIEHLQKQEKFFDLEEKKQLVEKIVTVRKMIFKNV